MNPLTHPERRRRLGGRRGSDRHHDDTGVLGWWRAFYAQWGAELQGALGVVLLVVASVVAYVALEVKDLTTDADIRSKVAAQQSADARTQARVSCQRSRTFGPALAAAYERYEILSPSQLEAYRASIPKSCP